jgi:hypothetical protein
MADPTTNQSLNTNPGTENTKEPATKTNYSFLDVSAYPHRYFLELYDSPQAKEPLASIQLPFVSNIEMSQPLSVQRTWTLDGNVYEEHSGFQQRSFRVRGRSGFAPLHLTRFAKLRNFLEKYASLSAENKNAFVRAKDIRLAINFPWEGEAFWATVISFKYTRDVGSTRVSYTYEIDLVTNGVASQRWDPKNGLSYLTCGDTADGCHIDPTHFCAKRAEEITFTVPPEYAEDLPRETITTLVDLRDDVPRWTITTDPGYVRRVRALCLRAQLELLSSYRAMLEPRKSGFRAYAETTLRWVLDLRMQCELYLGGLLLKVDLDVSLDFSAAGAKGRTPPQTIPSRGAPVIAVTVTNATSAHDVAGQYLGNRNAWTQIVEVNGMLDARTKSDGSPLGPRDVLLVPAVGGLADIDPESFYGTGYLIREGDLVSVGDRDIALVSGIENFYQNYSSRMRTIRGANKSYPDFGLRRVVGTTPDSDMPAMLLSEVQRQTFSDHRVRDIDELTLKEFTEGYEISLAITTALQEKKRASFVHTP